MLLIIVAALLVALGLQLRARPTPVATGYYLGADGVICMTSWKIVERSQAARPQASVTPVAAPGRPWGAPAHEALAEVRAERPASPLRLASPIRFEAADLAACLGDDRVRPAEAILIPPEIVAELFLPPGRLAPGAAGDRCDPPSAPALQALLRAPAQSLALH